MKYYCNAEDFFYARGFAFVTGEGEIVDTLKAVHKEGMLKFLTLFLSAVPFVILTGVISMIPDFKYTAHVGVPSSIVIVILIVGAFLNIGKYNKEYKMLEERIMNYPSNLDENVMIYEVTGKGLYFNRYNRASNSDMLFIPWHIVKDGELDYLRYTDNTNKDQSEKRIELNRIFDETRKRYSDFEGTRNLTHRDKKMILLNKDKVRYEVVPLPKGWTEDEIRKFVEDIENYIPVVYREE